MEVVAVFIVLELLDISVDNPEADLVQLLLHHTIIQTTSFAIIHVEDSNLNSLDHDIFELLPVVEDIFNRKQRALRADITFQDT